MFTYTGEVKFHVLKHFQAPPIKFATRHTSNNAPNHQKQVAGAPDAKCLKPLSNRVGASKTPKIVPHPITLP
jgi:hypothetical protein